MNWEKGQSLVELLVAIGIFFIAISALALFILDSYVSGRLAQEITIANFLAEEGIEATTSIRDNFWDDLILGAHGLVISPEGHWIFEGSYDATDKFTRVITVEDIGIDRKKITSQVTWQFTQARPQEIRLITYLTNWAEPMPPYLTQLHYRWRNDNGGE